MLAATWIAFLMLTVVPLPATVQANESRDMFRDLPVASWEYKALELLKQHKLVDNFSSKRTLTRYEVAVAIDRAMRGHVQGRRNPALNATTAIILHRFLVEYAEELTALPTKPTMQRKWLAIIRAYEPVDGPFVNVPKTHWAADAVERLRTRGILRGYPDGLFRG